MRKRCAWCKKDMGEVSGEADGQRVITHGICEECAFHLIAQGGMPLQEFLDGLPEPVMAVDSDVNVQMANKEISRLLHKDLSLNVGAKGGEVFECKYARFPEGCGGTIHCSGCAIRRTITETFLSGQSQEKVPACLRQIPSDPGEEQAVRFLISTEKVNGVVLLRIDEVELQ